MDLDAYLARIGYAGERRATLDVLQSLVAAHTQSIPFENIDVLLGRPIRLDLPSLESKLVLQRRGGFCFEQNTLFAAVLAALGFSVRSLAARVCWRAPPDAPPLPRTHMLLRVDLAQQAWLVDVGFGHSPPAALALRSGIEQPTAHDVYRLVPGAGGLELQVGEAGGWQPMYRFSGETQMAADHQMACFYVSNAPESIFRRQLMMARVGAGARYSLTDNRYTVRPVGGAAQAETITSVAALRALIAGPLGCQPPDGPDFEALLVRLAGR